MSGKLFERGETVGANRYFTVTASLHSPSGKTQIFDVWSVDSKAWLGRIEWFARWRNYTFQPNSGTVYDKKCLRELANIVEWLNAYQRGKNPT